MHRHVLPCFALLLTLAAGTASANNTSAVSNGMNEAVRVYWTAAGCAKVVDGKTFVCDSKVVEPGQTAEYTYKALTSTSKVAVSGPKACDGKKAVGAGVGVMVGKDCALSEVVPKFTNKRGETIKFFWMALGCAGVDEGVTFVCRSIRLAPGESDTYSFPKATTERMGTWISAKCPTAFEQRIGSAVYLWPDNHTNDQTACGQIKH